MRLLKYGMILLAFLLMSACSDSNSGSNGGESGFKLPSSIGTVPVSEDGRSSSAFDDAGTDYARYEPESVHVGISGDDAIDFVNNVLCFVNQVVPQDNIDQGPYVALVEESHCFGGETTYQSVTADVTANGTGFRLELFWKDRDAGVENRVRFDIDEGVSEQNPYGRFRMYMRMGTPSQISSGQGGGKGYLSVDRNDQGQIAIAISMDPDLSDTTPAPMQFYSLTSADGTSGTALSTFPPDGLGATNVTVAFDDSHIRADFNAGADLCLDRSSIREEVYGYALFYKNDGDGHAKGDLVPIRTGIGFTYNDNGVTRYGHISAWGYWTDWESTAGTYSVTGEDGNAYTLTVDSALTATLTDGSSQPVTFDGVLEFSSYQHTTDNDRNNGNGPWNPVTLAYFGVGTMGIFDTNNPPGVLFSLRDGTTLSRSGIDYVVRAVDIEQQPVAESAMTPCNGLSAPDHSDNLADLTTLDAGLFPGTLQAASSAPKYIGGMLQAR